MSDEQLHPPKPGRLETVPMTLKEAARYVRRWHRHHIPARIALWAVGCRVRGTTEVCGVAVVGQPKARLLRDGFTAEVVRVATDGTPNACSYLYSVARRAAAMLGWRRLPTYTLFSESGASLRALNLPPPVRCKGGTWDRPSRPRKDKHPTQPKLRWELLPCR